MSTGHRKIKEKREGRTVIRYLFDPNIFQEEKKEARHNAIAAAEENVDFHRELRTMHQCHLLEILYRYPNTCTCVIIKSPLGTDACCACQDIEGQELRIIDELQGPSIPLNSCRCVYDNTLPNAKTGFCRCYYEPVMDEEV